MAPDATCERKLMKVEGVMKYGEGNHKKERKGLRQLLLYFIECLKMLT